MSRELFLDNCLGSCPERALAVLVVFTRHLVVDLRSDIGTLAATNMDATFLLSLVVFVGPPS